MKPPLPPVPLLLPVNRHTLLSLLMNRPRRVLATSPHPERNLGSTLSGGALGNLGVELVGLAEVRMKFLLLVVVPALLGSLGAGVREGPVGPARSSLSVRA